MPNPSFQDASDSAASGRWLLRAAVAVLLIRALVVAAGMISASIVQPTDLDPKYASGWALFAWDSIHYRTILMDGYPRDAIQPIIAFFPGYPLAARPLAGILAPELALLITANACAVVGLVLMFVWGRGLAGDRIAFAGTLLASAFPPAMFLSAAYVQGPMLLLVAATLLLMRKSNWIGAGVCSGLATGLHPTGLALATMVGLCGLAKRVQWPMWLACAVLSVSGLLAYEGFLWARYGSWDAYMKAQENWSVDVGTSKTEVNSGLMPQPFNGSPSQALADVLPEFLRKAASFGAWNKAWLLVILLTSVVGFIRPGPMPRWLFALPLVIFLLGYVPGQGARVTSIARLETVALPCFILAATWLSRWRPVLWTGVVLMTVIQAWQAFAFTRGDWAG